MFVVEYIDGVFECIDGVNYYLTVVTRFKGQSFMSLFLKIQTS